MSSFRTAILLVIAVVGCDSNPTPHPMWDTGDVSAGKGEVMGSDPTQVPGDVDNLSPEPDDDGPDASADANDGRFDEVDASGEADASEAEGVDGAEAGASGDDDNGTGTSPDGAYRGDAPMVHKRRRP